MIRDRRIAIGFRSASFIFILIGLLLHMGIFIGTANFSSFMYYTIQSNVLALILFGILLVRTAMACRQEGKTGKTGYFARFEMVCVVDLLLTLIVYWLLLAPGAFNMGDDFSLFSFENLAVHLIAPVLCLIDYLLFTEPGHMKYRDVYAILIYPLAYVAFSSAAGFGGYVYRVSSIDGSPVRFPYFFFDYDQMGAKAFLYIAALVAVFLVISHLMYFIDRNRANRVASREQGTSL